ncbi:MAG: NAD(P)/FAD-dependent oxidoreductase [Deltaproteobacteria bacterium]|nr:NAD(P)/FAD-dependent oxidoreductase [Deltaproteobacteria bacterium]
MKRLLIIGNGVAGTTAAEQIRKRDREASVTIVTDEAFPFYSRIRLNEYISGDLGEKDLLVRKETWYKEQDLDLRLGIRIADGDPEKKALKSADGEIFSYDTLLVATGSHSFVPPIAGAERKGVFTLRSVQDARDIASWAGSTEEVVLIGGGLLGLEAGNALRKLGKRITVVEFFPRLLPRQLDVEGAGRLQKMMEAMGFSFRLGAKTQEILGEDRTGSVLLEGGERLPAGMVLISAGVRPNMELADLLGLERDKGIKVDDRLRTSRPDVYAAGDVAEFQGMPYGIWTAAMEQGKIAGINMAGGDEIYRGTTMANTLKVVGIDLASAGNIDAENRMESRVVSDEKVYRKIVLEGDRIVGCIMLGDTKMFPRITRVMSEKRDVSALKDRILTDEKALA